MDQPVITRTGDNAGTRTSPRSGREWALNIGAVAGTLCIVVALASIVFGITPLVVRSASMAPDMPTGSLAIARTVPATDLRVGDVVSVDNATGTRITHRIVETAPVGDRVALTLRGDANRVTDPLPYVVGEADRVLVDVPLLGYAAAWLSSKTAIFLGGLVAGALLMLAFGPIRRPGDTPANSDSATPDSATPDSASTDPADAASAHADDSTLQEKTHV